MPPTTAPVVRLTLAMLDAPDVRTLASVCAQGVLELFGAQAVRVCEGEAVWSEASVASDPAGPTATLRLRLSDNDASAVTLEVTLERGPDLAIVRQQLLDVVAVARRAWRDRRLLGEERQLARKDTLTGVENRRGGEDHLEREILLAQRSGATLAVMVIDLDHFKRVNDIHGHPAGDAVLRFAADCFREHLRPTDRVSRWGGDEFLVVLPDVSGAEAVAVAERLRVAFGSSEAARGTTLSIGIAQVHALDPARRGAMQLVELADRCLYEAKRAGRDRIGHAVPPDAVAV